MELPHQQPFTEFANRFFKQATETFPERKTVLTIAYYALPAEAELKDYCARHLLPFLGQILAHDTGLFAMLEDTCFLPGVEFGYFFDPRRNRPTEVLQGLWTAVDELLALVLQHVDPHDPKYRNLKNDFLQTMDEEFVQERLRELMKTIEEMDLEEEEELNGPQQRRSFERSVDWANKLSGMKIGALVEEIMSMIQTEFPDIYAELVEMQKRVEGDGQSTAKVAFQLFQEYMKRNSQRWREVMGMMQKVLQKKIDNNEVSAEQLMRESTEVLAKLGGMSKQELKKHYEQLAGKLLPKNSQVNISSMKQKMNRDIQRARLREKAKASREQAEAIDSMPILQHAPTANDMFYARLNHLSKDAQNDELDRLAAEIDAIGNRSKGKRGNR